MIVNTEAGNIREVYQISLPILRVGTSVAQSSYYLHAFSSSGKHIDHADLTYIIAEECCKNTAKMMSKYQFLCFKKVWRLFDFFLFVTHYLRSLVHDRNMYQKDHLSCATNQHFHWWPYILRSIHVGPLSNTRLSLIFNQ